MTTTLQPWQRVRLVQTMIHPFGPTLKAGQQGQILRKYQDLQHHWLYAVLLDEREVILPFREWEIEVTE